MQLLGEKTTFPPYWLINACQHRGWTYATASYRLLPEAEGRDIVEDALDAIRWVYKNISRRIIIAGSSAGGYLALAAAANPSCPKPLGLLCIYAMLDFLNGRYINPGQPLRKTVDDENGALAEIDAAMQSRKAIDEYPFPSNLAMDQRFKWVATLHQTARYIDVLTRSPGLTEKITKEGVEIIPEEHRPLFPATFGLSKDFPPTVLLHGDADELVDFELSAAFAAKLESLGLDVHLERVIGQGHGLDAQYMDLDSEENVEDLNGKRESLKRVVKILERYSQTS